MNLATALRKRTQLVTRCSLVTINSAHPYQKLFCWSIPVVPVLRNHSGLELEPLMSRLHGYITKPLILLSLTGLEAVVAVAVRHFLD